VLLLLAIAAPPLPLRGQSQRDSAVAAASRRRDQGDLAGAIAILRPYVAQHPDDAVASRQLAQLFYWTKATGEARALYESTLARHPNDAQLRLEYGRMLLETRDARLTAVVDPLLRGSSPRDAAAAANLLGTAAYWSGDLSTAMRHFRLALAADSSLADARLQLGEITSLTAPWVRASAELRHDDQPLDRIDGEAEAGWYATPLTAITARAGASRLQSSDSVTLTMQAAELRLTHYAAPLHTDLDAAASVLQRSAGGSTDWTGRLGAGVRLPHALTLSLRGERDVYLYTVASLSTPVMTRTGAATLA
jgi:tetratricopeptide (TPR) repeat protein